MTKYYDPIAESIPTYRSIYFHIIAHDGLTDGRMYQWSNTKEHQYLAVQGYGGHDWAVYQYIGLDELQPDQWMNSDFDIEDDAARTASWGHKLEQWMGECMFPEWAKVLQWRV